MLAAESQLNRWRRAELLYRVAAGLGYTLAIVLVLLASACAIDWTIDRTQDTPFPLRATLTGAQVVAALIALLVGRVRVPKIDELAAKAEELVPAFGHRLVTAIQLTRDSEKASGVSKAMLRQVAFEAEALAERHALWRFADVSRLSVAAAVLIPIVFGWGLFIAIRPGLASVLVQRQMLLSAAIPRAVMLENLTPPVLPAGDPVIIRISAIGRLPEELSGSLTISPEEEPSETVPLRVESRSETEAVLVADWPAESRTLVFNAYAGGGRLNAPGRVEFASRPSVASLDAFVILPKYVDPDGVREYRRHMPQGEIFTVPDSSAEISAEFSKPVTTAALRFVKRDTAGGEADLSRTPMTLAESRTSGMAHAEIPEGATGYRVEATDDNGFTTQYPPYRTVTVTADRPPEVSLLPEVLKDPKEDGPLDDFLVDGMPLRLGGQVQVGYAAKSLLGIDKVFVVYRVNEGAWSPLPLTPVVPDLEKTGPFVPDLGVFRESGPFGQVELYKIPAQDPETQPGGLEAGGRINFQTAALRKRPPGAVEDVPLEIGDTVEIRVAVYDRKPGPTRPPTAPPAISGEDEPRLTDSRRPAGWSAESRLKQVVTDAKFEEWRREHYRTRVKLADLEQKQRDVFRRRE